MKNRRAVIYYFDKQEEKSEIINSELRLQMASMSKGNIKWVHYLLGNLMSSLRSLKIIKKVAQIWVKLVNIWFFPILGTRT